jgi:hypothetical protein
MAGAIVSSAVDGRNGVAGSKHPPRTGISGIGSKIPIAFSIVCKLPLLHEYFVCIGTLPNLASKNYLILDHVIVHAITSMTNR